MDDTVKSCRQYIKQNLAGRIELEEYIEQTTILLNAYEGNHVWDLMILMDSEWFKYEFAYLHSEYFIVDDHDHDPPVFARVKSYAWLEKNFSKRLPVALWIFENAVVVQEHGNDFSRILAEQRAEFVKSLRKTVRRKYLEMRGERHNLRYSVKRLGDMANILLKSNIVKLCFELLMLAEGRPYPFGILLPEYVRSQSSFGDNIFAISNQFLAETDPDKTIELSDCLIEKVASALSATGNFSSDFLSRWWLYLK
ncbi:MAG TPA: hypothetical protein P5323_03185 [Candidatus Moranbacteria bacterium]|nr:hypothetical protein [Candidatus Moranbacteria bacterium]HRY28116.1 hypothetical protein [Candidatus Moranbacteria bacterium]HSA08281.1 hypothetical protein [Candidatus Moranbacteria bacterium]